MTTPLVIEEERGTCTGNYHPHNGYYAGDFSMTRPSSPSTRVGSTGAVPALPLTSAESLRMYRSAA